MLSYYANKPDHEFEFVRGYVSGTHHDGKNPIIGVDVNSYWAFKSGYLAARADAKGKQWPVGRLPTDHPVPISEYLRGFILGYQMIFDMTVFTHPLCPSCARALKEGYGTGLAALSEEYQDFVLDGGRVN
jgi:hypothetical protein